MCLTTCGCLRVSPWSIRKFRGASTISSPFCNGIVLFSFLLCSFATLQLLRSIGAPRLPGVGGSKVREVRWNVGPCSASAFGVVGQSLGSQSSLALRGASTAQSSSPSLSSSGPCNGAIVAERNHLVSLSLPSCWISFWMP